uniref:Uncharacterized protein n=1 Tax=Amphimedon queenslandica TaxID=400682 RepID=A0A1X7VUR3_AMPQE
MEPYSNKTNSNPPPLSDSEPIPDLPDHGVTIPASPAQSHESASAPKADNLSNKFGVVEVEVKTSNPESASTRQPSERTTSS